MFDGYLKVMSSCSVCGLDYGGVDTGDGPAVFVMSFIGFAVVMAALIVEVTYQPPYWVHAVIWLPAILGGALGLLRPAKGVFIALAYRYRSNP